jgi:hypothetical protein
MKENNLGIAKPSRELVTDHSITAKEGRVCSGPWECKDQHELVIQKNPRMLNTAIAIARRGES